MCSNVDGPFRKHSHSLVSWSIVPGLEVSTEKKNLSMAACRLQPCASRIPCQLLHWAARLALFSCTLLCFRLQPGCVHLFCFPWPGAIECYFSLHLLANSLNCYFINSLRYISIWSAPSISPNCRAKSQPSICEQAFLPGYKILTRLKCYRCLHCLICIYSCIVPLKKSVHTGVYFTEKWWICKF